MRQTELRGQLVFFSWEGHPRWPGVVVPPQDRRGLLKGTRGYFYRPEEDILEKAYVRDYKTGEKMEQRAKSGAQKTSVRKVRVDDPFSKRYVLIYSLGDEMYKWVPATGIWPYKQNLKEEYSFPPGPFEELPQAQLQWCQGVARSAAVERNAGRGGEADSVSS